MELIQLVSDGAECVLLPAISEPAEQPKIGGQPSFLRSGPTTSASSLAGELSRRPPSRVVVGPAASKSSVSSTRTYGLYLSTSGGPDLFPAFTPTRLGSCVTQGTAWPLS